MKKAFIFWGGWDGHHPQQVAERIDGALREVGFDVQISDSLDLLSDVETLKAFDLVVPCWTMGALSGEQSAGLQTAIRSGVGLGGIHGGMGDAFRGNLDYEWMVGGHFVGHPHVGNYEVVIRDPKHVITEELPPRFAYRSEQYYLMLDPGIHVLADTQYQHEDQSVTMPVAWIKTWGSGRVFYSALGHELGEFEEFPPAWQLTVQGLVWAAR
jgi:type 1 glutamine amidotransferase